MTKDNTDNIVYELEQLNENSQAMFIKMQTMASSLEFIAYNLNRIADAMEKKQ